MGDSFSKLSQALFAWKVGRLQGEIILGIIWRFRFLFVFLPAKESESTIINLKIMRKYSMKAMLVIAVMMGLGLGLASCSKDDNAVISPETPAATSQP